MYRNEEPIGREDFPRDEMLLDVCLEEILSGQAPPDLSAQILAAVQRSQAAVPTALPVAPPLAEPPLASPPLAVPITNGRSSTSSTRARVVAARRQARAARQQWIGYIAAAALAFVGLGMGLIAWQSAREAGDGPAVATEDVHNKQTREVVALPTVDEHRVAMADAFVEPLFGAEPMHSQSQRGVPWQLPYAVDPQDDAKVIAFVNERLARRWANAGVSPAAEADDDQWCRRVFQQTIGREPTSEEIVDFAASNSPDKRTRSSHSCSAKSIAKSSLDIGPASGATLCSRAAPAAKAWKSISINP